MGRKSWAYLLDFLDKFYDEELSKEIDFSEKPIELAVKNDLLCRVTGEDNVHKEELTYKGFMVLVQYRLKKSIDKFNRTTTVLSIIMIILTLAIIYLTFYAT